MKNEYDFHSTSFLLKIFTNELEKQSKYENLHDWASPILLKRGKDDSPKAETYASLKSSIKISKCGGKDFFATGRDEKFVVDISRFKRNVMTELPIVVRVYIVQAMQLRSRDVYSESDAFIKIELAGQEISDRAQYVPNQANPVFGKRFQMSTVIPRDTSLKVSVFDRDTLSRNDLIGSTVIDLEDRVRTKYAACCGLPREFNATGYNAWRNSMLPSQILNHLCTDLELSAPQYFPELVQLGGCEFQDTNKISKDDNKKERLALSVLNNFDRIPGVGFAMIPEHVETRSLFHDDRPGLEQGKLMMWVEIFDPKKAVPEPIDITPLPPQPFELRVIVWNAKDVTLNEKNIFGNQMSDIYVKGWLENVDDSQFTDIHYRSLNGEGNFNWRMLFKFKYSIGEDMVSCLIKSHGH